MSQYSNIIKPANAIPRWPFTINRQSEQARGLVVWLAMGTPGGNSLFDSQRNVSFSTAGSVTTLGGVAPCVETLNTAAEFSLGDASLIIPTTEVTIAVCHRKTDGTNRTSALFSVNDGDTAKWCDVLCPFSDGTLYWDFGGAAGNNRVSLAGQSFAEQTWWTFTAGPAGMVIYRNGTEVANNGGVAVTRGSSSANFYFHGFPVVISGGVDLCQVFDFRVYSRQRSASEVWALYDPATRYELYQPAAARSYFFVPAPAGTIRELSARISTLTGLKASSSLLRPIPSKITARSGVKATGSRVIPAPANLTVRSSVTDTLKRTAAISAKLTGRSQLSATSSILRSASCRITNYSQVRAASAIWRTCAAKLQARSAVICGAVEVIEVGPTRLFRVRYEERIFTVPAETRIFRVT